MTHTPGPWRFTPFLGEPGDLEKMRELGMKPPMACTNEGQRYVMAGEGDGVKRVALVDLQVEAKRNARYQTEDPERDANARLIAAAPSMLETLEALERDFERRFAGGGGKISEQLRAVIAQAKGKQA